MNTSVYMSDFPFFLSYFSTEKKTHCKTFGQHLFLKFYISLENNTTDLAAANIKWGLATDAIELNKKQGWQHP